jgi:hypothetical protein
VIKIIGHIPQKIEVESRTNLNFKNISPFIELGFVGEGGDVENEPSKQESRSSADKTKYY